MLDFLKSISMIKRDPLDLKVALERVAIYDKERGKDSWEVKTILKQNEYDFLNIRHAKIEEVIPAILGFDYEKYDMLRIVSKIQQCSDNIIAIAEKSIAEIPEELPESAKQELRDNIEKDIAKERRQPRTLYSSGGAALCNRISHFLELFRRAYISGDVAICGDWIDLDTIVDTKVFFEWVQRNGFYIPEEVSCLLTGPTVTAPTTEPDHDQQVEEPARIFKTPKQFADYYRSIEGVKFGWIMLEIVDRWGLKNYAAAAVALGDPVPEKGSEAAKSYGERFRYYTRLLDQSE